MCKHVCINSRISWSMNLLSSLLSYLPKTQFNAYLFHFFIFIFWTVSTTVLSLLQPHWSKPWSLWSVWLSQLHAVNHNPLSCVLFFWGLFRGLHRSPEMEHTISVSWRMYQYSLAWCHYPSLGPLVRTPTPWRVSWNKIYVHLVPGTPIPWFH